MLLQLLYHSCVSILTKCWAYVAVTVAQLFRSHPQHTDTNSKEWSLLFKLIACGIFGLPIAYGAMLYWWRRRNCNAAKVSCSELNRFSLLYCHCIATVLLLYVIKILLISYLSHLVRCGPLWVVGLQATKSLNYI